ncbi:SSI family serine proteinase inhibitor [Catenulispora pinisilvae]|uniref:SSI family serine proteinase inhibitor n=1 Tax=Catenulispora pinisilvae TaxID=2705253 RepID=UPI001891EC90|nr:SSI family serine proteinase inhibitor [Catenulispora pinisilvae]
MSTSPISVPMIPAPMLPAPMNPAPALPAPAPGTVNPGGFAIHLLGGLHLKRVDTTTGQTHTGYLLCTSTTSGTAAPVIHGVGGVKDATSACTELAAVNGDFDALAVHPTWMAPSFMAPVAVQAAGTWEGAKVAWSHQYSNSGVLVRTSGDVFVF